MISAEIKLYPEPVQYTTHTGGSYNNHRTTPEWKAKVEEHLKTAHELYRVGDTVCLKSNSNTRVRIKGFNCDPEKVISYKEKPCVLSAINVLNDLPNIVGTSYSLDELDWNTLEPYDEAVTKSETETTMEQDQNGSN